MRFAALIAPVVISQGGSVPDSQDGPPPFALSDENGGGPAPTIGPLGPLPVKLNWPGLQDQRFEL